MVITYRCPKCEVTQEQLVMGDLEKHMFDCPWCGAATITLEDRVKIK